MLVVSATETVLKADPPRTYNVTPEYESVFGCLLCEIQQVFEILLVSVFAYSNHMERYLGQLISIGA